MRFSIASAVTIVAGLTASGSAFVMDTFSGTDCNNLVQNDVNVWDNSCATWPEGFQSFRIKTWGGGRQHAYFIPGDHCSIGEFIRRGYVDSTTYDFKMGDCYNFNGKWATAIASYFR